MGGLSILVGAVALSAGTVGYLGRHALPSPLIYVLGHAAVSGAIISLASSNYLCNSTASLLGKSRSSGRFHPLASALFWPFHVGLHLRITLRRMFSEEPLFHEIVQGWYLGGWPHSPAILPSAAQGLAVVDCTCEFGRRHDQPYICLPTWDTQGVSEQNIDRAVTWALEQRAKGRAVLVHCAHGHGRSLGVLCACLVMAGTFQTYQEVVAAAKSVRPKCKLNRAQARSLEAYLRQHKKLL